MLIMLFTNTLLRFSGFYRRKKIKGKLKVRR